MISSVCLTARTDTFENQDGGIILSLIRKVCVGAGLDITDELKTKTLPECRSIF